MKFSALVADAFTSMLSAASTLSSSQRHTCVAAVAVAVVLVGVASQATATTLCFPATCIPSAASSLAQVVVNTEQQIIGTSSATATLTSGSSSATATASPNPNPDVSVEASVGKEGEALALAEMTYYFIPTYATGQTGLPVDAIINLSGSITQSITSSLNGANVEFGVPGNESYLAHIYCGEFNCNGTSFNIAMPETLLTGTQYLLTIVVQISADTLVEGSSGTSDSQSGSVDPFIAFAPTFDSTGFQLNFSPGISNDPSTPLPATLPLFASGLGALGLLSWRRKRKGYDLAARRGFLLPDMGGDQ